MIRFRTLGSLDLGRAEGPELRAVLAQPKRLALLAYLAVARPHGFHRRDHLLAMFWPDSDVERARAALSRAIYFLRRELGDGTIDSRGDEELAINRDRLWCDASIFEELVTQNESREALELYRGDLLPGFFISDANGFEEWLEHERTYLRRRASRAAWDVAGAAETAGQYSVAAHWARRGVDLAPFSEPELRRLLVLLDKTGDRAGAVEAYQRFSSRLSGQLELTPAPETRALVEEIRARATATPSVAYARVREDRLTPPESKSAVALRSPRRERKWVLAAAAIAVVITTPAILLARSARRPFDAHRVSVVRFANVTGDAAFDAVARATTDRIVQRLSGTGLVEVVAPDKLGDSIDGSTIAAPQGTTSRQASRRRVGVVVSGDIQRLEGRVSIQAWITDATRGRVVWAVPPIPATPDSMYGAIDEVQERTAGAVAALNVARFAGWFPIASTPPRFAAFQEFAHGVDLQLRGADRDALPHLQRAVKFDSAFTWAQLQLAVVHLKLFEEQISDSIAQALDHVRERLMPLQRHRLDWLLSLKAEDPLAGYRALRAAAGLAPDAFLYDLADAATRLNRPRESIDLLERIGPDNPYNQDAEYWGLLNRAYHAQGDRRREFAVAREARARFPDRIDVLSFALSALAADGKTQEVNALLDTALAFPRAKVAVPGVIADMMGRGLWPGRLMITAATEFRAHGFTAAADETFRRAIDWYVTQRPDHVPDEAYRFELARAHYLARDWVHSEAIFRSLATDDTSNFVYSGFLAAIAARQGDTTTARRILAQFDSLRSQLVRPHAMAGYWQSKINALLGNEAAAIRSLREAFGPQGRSGMHRDFDFEAMWDSREFRNFVRPKG